MGGGYLLRPGSYTQLVINMMFYSGGGEKKEEEEDKLDFSIFFTRDWEIQSKFKLGY